MYGVIIALLPALLVSFYFFGIGSAIVCATSVISCLFFEWAITRYILGQQRLTILDGSAAVTGLLLGMNLPSTLPIWMIVVGALVGRCFLLVSCPTAMTSWPVAGQFAAYTDATTAATPLALMKMAIKGDTEALDKLPSAFDMLLGNAGEMAAGTIGEVCALALLIGLAYMLWKRIITWHIPVSIISTVFVIAGLLWLCDSTTYADPLTVIFSGGLMLGAIFMATDYVTSPMCAKGQIIYGVAIGFLTIVIRNWGAYPEGMSFAILIMNAFTPLINMYIKPKRFGEVVKK